jgi:hypothetical protein
MVDVARRLCEDNQIRVNEFWSYHAIGDQVRFTLVHRSREQAPRAPAPRTPAPQARAAAKPAKSAASRRKPAARARTTPKPVRKAARAARRK